MGILVPYDGSYPAQEAVKYAINATDDEEIMLLRVIEVADGMIEAGINLVQEEIKQRQAKVDRALSEEIKTLLDTHDVEFRIETAVGKPAREIVSFAHDHDVTQIVMGSHGRDGVSHVLLGSVAEKVVRRAPTTVTVVR